jgi:hypothetical protein
MKARWILSTVGNGGWPGPLTIGMVAGQVLSPLGMMAGQVLSPVGKEAGQIRSTFANGC